MKKGKYIRMVVRDPQSETERVSFTGELRISMRRKGEGLDEGSSGSAEKKEK